MIFKQARVKLTAWYLLIIMAITLSFSAVVYFGTIRNAKGALQLHEQRFNRRLFDLENDDNPPPQPKLNHDIYEMALEEINTDTIKTLGFINLFIFVTAGGLSFFLASKTLSPIELMLEKQKRFIADAAHEFKTPLTGLKTSLEVALRNNKLHLSDAKITIQDAIEDIDNLADLVNALIRQSRHHSDTNELSREIVNLHGLLKEAISKVSQKAKEKNIEIKNDSKDKSVVGNKNGILELFVILIDNAVKFSDEDSEVSITSRRHGKIVETIIQDYGEGIKTKDLPYIFDRFYKADSARSESGHGLGLSIAKEIAANNNGSIAVDSEYKKGSTFSVKLPSA